MEKKKVIITLSKFFPATHSKAGSPTHFEDGLKSGRKIHTIRMDKKFLWEKRCKDINSGKKFLDVREWTGRPYNSEQRRLAEFQRIGLQHITMTYSSTDAVPQAWVGGKKIPVEELAKNDGLSTEDFIEFFFGSKLYNSNTFEGVVIHFTDFRY